MNPILRNVIAVIAGAFLGGVLNMFIVVYSGTIIPFPEGVDHSTAEGLSAGMHLFEPKHFLMPFLAHALGTLLAAFVCTKIAVRQKLALAMLMGVFFLVGGVMMVFELPSPAWFNATDLILAYIPMAWIGYKLGS
ncbi:hypothetical protein [Croceimicrobium hydrocarbonivorans]|uniref:Uncharacterized protein n=1 Tax=Croceimicrobium hydrocarbonivorans TaxID=2761580 RepID=A0A7H0VG42_9FLAO|nr:hypothetical protein [Croceimicrobium hydrocarbonivorans]QNR24690.1 hypothetical protein H4K34_02270 [Croceimicrobium hydrocarbonivorans]